MHSFLREATLILFTLTSLVAVAQPDPKPSIPFTIENFVDLSQEHHFVQGGIPLPKGYAMPESALEVLTGQDDVVAAEVKITAYWPDGSVKWILVRMQPDLGTLDKQPYTLRIAEGASPEPTPFAQQDAQAIHVDTGQLRFTVSRIEANLLRDVAINIAGNWVPIATDTELFVDVDYVADGETTRAHYGANAATSGFTATLEEASPLLAVIRLDGVHADAEGATFAPYTVRLYAYKEDSRVRLYHSFVFDGDSHRDFIRAIGVRLKAAPETVTGYTLAENRGTGFPTAYIDDPSLPAWRRGILTQNSADAYTIKKVINPETNSKLRATAGTRSQGWGRLDTAQGSISVAVRNFWQEYPKAIEIDAVDRTLTAYFYSPYGDPLDLRRYSDLGYHSLYEAGAKGPNTPATPFDQDMFNATGISKSSELIIDFAAPDAPAARSASLALLAQRPPLLRASPAWMGATGVFGHFGALPLSGPGTDYFRTVMGFYPQEQERHRWYSFIDYGDVMHSFNPALDRWRFDEGGFAWLNNEGQISDSHWMAYLASGDEQLYRFVEAMTRHVQDVDMYQTGSFAGAGMRHNVNHWGGSNRERRMTISQNKRIYHFLSGDEHTADRIRFSYDMLPKGKGLAYYGAMDIGVAATALLFLWESTGEPHYGELLQKTCETFCANPIGGYGFPAFLDFDLETGTGRVNPNTPMLADFFLTFFGPLRVLMETSELTDNAVIRDRVLLWASLLLETDDVAKERQLHFGTDVSGAHSHLHAAAFAYRHTGDARYLEIIRLALENPALTFVTVGGSSPLQAPEHLSIQGTSHFQSNSNAITLYNFPFAFPLVEMIEKQALVPESVS